MRCLRLINLITPIGLFVSALPARASTLIEDITNLKNKAVVSIYGGIPPAVEPEDIAAAIVQSLFVLLGVIFIILMIIGGLMWMTSRGEEEEVGKAQKMLAASLIGLIIVISAAVVWAFIASRILKVFFPT